RRGADPGRRRARGAPSRRPSVCGPLAPGESGPIPAPPAATRTLSTRMQDAWLAFARDGRPRAAGLPDWSPYGPPRRATMILADPPRLVDAPQEPERAVWDLILG